MAGALRLGRTIPLVLLVTGCAALRTPTAPPPPSEVAPTPPASPVAPAAATPPDAVYEALQAERERQGLRAELAGLLGKSASSAAQVSPVFSGEPKVSISDERGGTLRIWRRDGEPWILQVDAAGTVTAYDIPSEGIAGRGGAAAAPPRAERKEIVDGLDDMTGLPIDSLIGDGFTPVDRAKLPGGGRIYTFRTPERYFLSLGTDGDGVIRAWSTNLPGLERPLRLETAAKP